MRRIDVSPVRARAIALALAILLHLAMLAALIATSSMRTVSPPKPPLLVTLSMPQAIEDKDASMPSKRPDEPKTSARPPPVLPPSSALPVATTPLPPPEPIDFAALEPQFDTEPDPALTGDAVSTGSLNPNAGALDTECPSVSAFREALEFDLGAQAALAQIPRPSRSVANAVMLWDGAWIVPEGSDPASMAAVRSTIAEIISSFSEACRSQTNFGPVFVPVDSETGTIFLALGSGKWRWADLMQDSFVEPVGPNIGLDR